MKRYITAFLAAALLVTVTGCGNTASQTAASVETLATFTEETGLPSQIIAAEDGSYYSLLNAYDSSEYAVSVSDSADTLHTIRDLPADTWTWYLDASADGAAWCEGGTTYLWQVYNAEDGTITEIDGDYPQNGFQNMKVGIYDGCVYYAHIDYSHETAEIIRYCIADGTSEPVYTFPYYGDITIHSLKVSGNYLTLAGCVDSEYPDAVVIDLDTNETTILEMGVSAGYVYDAAYDGETLALYYVNGETMEEQIGVYDVESRTITPVTTFVENYYAYHDSIDCVDGEIIWVEQKNVSGDIADHYSLYLYNIADGTTRTIPTVFAYDIAEDALYYLCYADGTKKIELRKEVWK